jgi:pre-mRNA-splicing factor RBM22/SLT11
MTSIYNGYCILQQSELAAPGDTSITTLWAGNLTPDITAEDIREAFYPYGHIGNIHLVAASKCAFVEYASRSEAEHAAKQLYKSLLVKGQSLSLNWAKPRTQATIEGGGGRSASSSSASSALLPPPGMESAPSSAYALPGMAAPTFGGAPAPLPPAGASGAPAKRQRTDNAYPSMNPNQNGSKL